jgi:DNA-directed RNA polymerase subunit K/omega
MPKKSNKKPSKDSDDEYEDVDEEVVDEVDDEEVDEDEDDEEDEDEEKNELIIEPDTESGNCIIEEAIEGDDIFFDNDEDTELPVENSAEYISKENRISANRLTKYEMVRILGERTKQLTMGAKPLVKNFKDLSYDKLAEEEFKLNMIPFKLKRLLPNGKFEIWTLDELLKDHLLALL